MKFNSCVCFGPGAPPYLIKYGQGGMKSHVYVAAPSRMWNIAMFKYERHSPLLFKTDETDCNPMPVVPLALTSTPDVDVLWTPLNLFNDVLKQKRRKCTCESVFLLYSFDVGHGDETRH